MGKSIKSTSAAMHSMMDNIINMSLACTSYQKVNDYLILLKRLDETIRIIDLIKIEKTLYDFFPELKEPIENINSHIDILKNKYDNSKKKTAKLLRKKTNSINRLINRFGIPYKISAKYNQGKINDYKLVHINDSNNKDSRNKLSSGEKNIISLIFFILTVEKIEDIMVLIDDPVSSYDECRRKIISDLIISRLNNKTTLLLSHDCVFAKYAAIDKKNNIGSINYLQNFDGNARLIEITKADFGDFHDFVLEHLKNCTNYYQKIMNLRMLYEGKHASSEYRYLSSLLHANTVNDINNLLVNNSLNENDLIDKIYSKFGVTIEPMTEYYNKIIDTGMLSFFEKALLLREYIKFHNNIDMNIKQELDGFIHLNSRLLISLNPYKYVICTPKVYNLVIENIS